MTPERWRNVKELLGRLLQRPAPERAAALDEACRDDHSLRAEIEELLDCHDEMGSFLEEPLIADVTDPPDEGLPPALRDWNQYQVLEQVGSGGMAVVYKAWDPRLRRLVAIKVISGHDDMTVKRFLREAESQARVDHPNVLKVYETGIIGPHHYIAMQYVDGPTLLGVREETTLDRKVRLMLDIAEGLHAAHRQGLVHRDIKPSNILVERGTEGLKPHLLDFGLAVDVAAPAMTLTGVVVGTPRYMAPERVHGGSAALDRRSDVYSLGATFYEFVSGVPPFASASGLQVLVDVLHADLEPLRSHNPRIPPEVDAIVAKCLDKDPDRRYPSARALAQDLRRHLDGEPVLARPVGAVERIARKVRRHPRLAAAFLILVSLTAAVAGWGTYGYWRAARQAELAQTLGQEVRDLEWLFRAAQMSPLHPIESEKRRVRERMSRLDEMMEEVGSLAFGPGHYALGRGLFALGDYANALQHLERAWESGYRTPDIATALGLAHGEVLRIELTAAQRIAADPERAARIRALEATHRNRALDFLEEGRSSAIVPAPYLEALMASHRREVPAAIAKAEEAAAATPWLFEARLLQGHLEFEEAVRLYLAGSVGAGAERARDADRYYAEAHRIATSSLDAYLGRCAVTGLLFHMAAHGLPGDGAYQQGVEACERALVVDPESADTHRLFGEALRYRANISVQRGEDPSDGYDRSAALVRRALELSGGGVHDVIALADTILDRAWWESRSGKDPRAALDQAVAIYEKALAIDPRSVAGADNMGQALLLRARFEVARGVDASDAQDRAVATFQRTLRSDPALAVGFRNLARAAIERADEHARRGVNPKPGLDSVVRFIEALPGDPALSHRVAALTRLRAASSGASRPH